MKKISLGILDQSIVHKGKTAKEAIEETIATVKLAEQLGYSRLSSLRKQKTSASAQAASCCPTTAR
jgi:hypothetical protein